MVSRVNRSCAYYPCHRRLEDCTFCYCPFYPCKDTDCGEYVTKKNGVQVWSCQRCTWVHTKRTVDAVHKIMRPLRQSLKDRACG